MVSEAQSVEVEETFFWENPEARAALAAQADLVNLEVSDSDSDVEETRVVVKKLSEIPVASCIADSAAYKWTKDQLYGQRLRKRDWRVRYDRMDAAGNGDHRVIPQ